VQHGNRQKRMKVGFFSSSANEGARLNQKIKIKFGTREGVNFLSVYSVSPEAVGRWPGGYKATV
jgi:hypothetical protein